MQNFCFSCYKTVGYASDSVRPSKGFRALKRSGEW